MILSASHHTVQRFWHHNRTRVDTNIRSFVMNELVSWITICHGSISTPFPNITIKRRNWLYCSICGSASRRIWPTIKNVLDLGILQKTGISLPSISISSFECLPNFFSRAQDTRKANQYRCGWVRRDDCRSCVQGKEVND